MPLTVITLKNSPPSLRGDLTKWMQEISTGVYVGNFNSKVREELWKRVVDSVGAGEATMTFAYRNEIGYNFQTHNSNKLPIDYDGIPLVFTPVKARDEHTESKQGFSKAAKMRKAKKYSGKTSRPVESIKPYVILDLETTGLDASKDLIIEIGAIKIAETVEEYTCLVKQDLKLTDTIIKLTGISQDQVDNGKDQDIALAELLDFIGDSPIVGYNINFDIKFINEGLKNMGRGKIKNQLYDAMKYVKQENMFLKNYKLETALKEYGIDEQVPHRALSDARLIQKLVKNLDGLMKSLR